MNKIIFFLFGLTLISSSINKPNNYNQDIITTFYLVRHAEKDTSDKSNKNPQLTVAGFDRANRISQTLSKVKIDAVYSTGYIRTTETAKPTAVLFNKEITIYNWNSLDIESLTKNNLGKNVLIVGHSNTTPIVANKLLGQDIYKQIDESEYSNLYIVTIINDKKSSTLLKVE